jgi:hypothetical protein
MTGEAAHFDSVLFGKLLQGFMLFIRMIADFRIPDELKIRVLDAVIGTEA